MIDRRERGGMPHGEWGAWPTYTRVADRRGNGQRHVAELAKQGRTVRPVTPSGRGRALATTFWGRAWCENLAAYASLVNRLQRGRSYLRNGLVIDLAIEPGRVSALVSGSDVYDVSVAIASMPARRWRSVVQACAGRIESVVELLAGRFDESVMAHVCRVGTGLFPTPDEIAYTCTCPDGWSGRWLCKHVAATLYGVGVRLDEEAHLLFRLRGVDPAELLAGATDTLAARRGGTGRRVVADDRLSAVFGIELEPAPRRPSGARRMGTNGLASGRPDRGGSVASENAGASAAVRTPASRPRRAAGRMGAGTSEMAEGSVQSPERRAMADDMDGGVRRASGPRSARETSRGRTDDRREDHRRGARAGRPPGGRR